MDADDLGRQMEPFSSDLKRRQPVIHRCNRRAPAAEPRRQGAAGCAQQQHLWPPIKLVRHLLDVVEQVIAAGIDVSVERASINVEARPLRPILEYPNRPAFRVVFKQKFQWPPIGRWQGRGGSATPLGARSLGKIIQIVCAARLVFAQGVGPSHRQTRSGWVSAEISPAQARRLARPVWPSFRLETLT